MSIFKILTNYYSENSENSSSSDEEYENNYRNIFFNEIQKDNINEIQKDNADEIQKDNINGLKEIFLHSILKNSNDSNNGKIIGTNCYVSDDLIEFLNSNMINNLELKEYLTFLISKIEKYEVVTNEDIISWSQLEEYSSDS